MVLGHPAGPPAHRPGGSGQHQRHQNLAARRPDPGSNEVAVLENRFIDLPGRLPISGIGWPTAIASAVNLWPISHDLRTPLTSLLGYLETLTLKDEWLTAGAQAVSHHRPARGTKCAISRSSCLSWRDWAWRH